MTSNPNRELLDKWDGESVLRHLREHDEFTGGQADPDGCDHCFVRPMLADVHAAWTSGNRVAVEVLWSLQDGFGEAGATPPQGLDWSGVRDSTPATVRRMWQAVHA